MKFLCRKIESTSTFVDNIKKPPKQNSADDLLPNKFYLLQKIGHYGQLFDRVTHAGRWSDASIISINFCRRFALLSRKRQITAVISLCVFITRFNRTNHQSILGNRKHTISWRLPCSLCLPYSCLNAQLEHSLDAWSGCSLSHIDVAS